MPQSNPLPLMLDNHSRVSTMPAMQAAVALSAAKTGLDRIIQRRC